MTEAPKGFTLVRTFEAAPERIWEAWTDPGSAAQWWHPRGASTPREAVRIDARTGGRYAYTMVDNTTGDAMAAGGAYLDVVPFRRLVFTWGVPDGDPEETPVVTVTLEPEGELTRMTFDLRGVEGTQGDGGIYDGWHEALDSLADYLGEPQTGP